MNELESVSKILDLINSAFTAGGNIQQLVGMFSGDEDKPSAVELLLEHIESELNLLVELEEQKIIEDYWEPYGKALNDINSILQEISNVLSTIKSQDGVFLVTNGDENMIDIKVWFEQTYSNPNSTIYSTKYQASIKTVLYQLTEVDPPTFKDAPKYSIVQPFVPQSFLPGGIVPFQNWLDIATLVNSSNNINGGVQFKNKSNFDIGLSMVSQVFNMVGTIYLIHDSIAVICGSQDSILPQIEQNIGCYTLPSAGINSTAWGNIGNILDGLINQPGDEIDTSDRGNYDQQIPAKSTLVSAYSSDCYTGPDNWTAGYPSFVTFEVTTQSLNLNVENHCFGSLQFIELPSLGNNTNADGGYGNYFVLLQGTPIQIGSNLRLTALSASPTADSLPFTDPNYRFSDDYGTYYNGMIYPLNYTNVLYAQPNEDTISNPNNVFNVITGFKVSQMQSGSGARLGLSLQFGQLDISDITNPKITIVDSAFVDSGWDNQGMAYTVFSAYADLRPAGTYDTTGALIPSIITNASILNTGPGGGRIGLSAKTALPLFRSDFFQPGKFASIIH
jgi:hypothetical protein